MTTIDCPYCAMATKYGELFCSKHHTSMHTLKSGIFFIESRKMEECDWHMTRLSLNFNFDGPQYYAAGTKSYKVAPDRYLLINEGQLFKTSFKSEYAGRMLTLAFEVGRAEKIFHTLSSTDQYQLDNPFKNDFSKIDFFESTYVLDEILYEKALSFSRSPVDDPAVLEEKLDEVLTYIVHERLKINEQISRIDKVRVATRNEIFRRLLWAKEYMHEHYSDAITIEDIAAVSCLSSFHFKRLFKSVYTITPHQYIKELRLKKAKVLLASGMSIREVCTQSGWEDVSSFIRLFKKEALLTPAAFEYKHGENYSIDLSSWRKA